MDAGKDGTGVGTDHLGLRRVHLALERRHVSAYALVVRNQGVEVSRRVLSNWPMAHHPTTEPMLCSPLQYHQQLLSWCMRTEM